jgi:hypothetical protein
VVNTVFPDSVEPEYYPHSTTYINLINISSSKKLQEKEAGFTVIRSLELFQKPDLIPITTKYAL